MSADDFSSRVARGANERVSAATPRNEWRKIVRTHQPWSNLYYYYYYYYHYYYAQNALPAFGPSFTRILTTRVLTIRRMKLTQSKAMKQRRFAWFWPSIVAACAQQPLVVTSNNINTNNNKKLLLLLTNQQTPTCDHWWLFFLLETSDIGRPTELPDFPYPLSHLYQWHRLMFIRRNHASTLRWWYKML